MHGKQFHHRLKKHEHFQGFTAPLSVTTYLFTLAADPVTQQCLKLFVGASNLGNEMLVRFGLHYTVDLATRRVSWLSTAPYALTSAHSVSAVYFTKE